MRPQVCSSPTVLLTLAPRRPQTADARASALTIKNVRGCMVMRLSRRPSDPSMMGPMTQDRLSTAAQCPFWEF